MTRAAVQHVVRVAVIDSGWTQSFHHGRVAKGCAFVGEDDVLLPTVSDDAHDRIGHGTRCGSAILNGSQHAVITPVRIFGRKLETSPPALCAALDWVASQEFDIVNLSLSTAREDVRDALYILVERIHRMGTLVVASACNGTGDGYPAVFDTVIGVVVAGDETTRPEGLAAVIDMRVPSDMVARLANVERTRVSNSLAAACVSGLAAEIISRDGRMGLTEMRELLCTPLALVPTALA